MLGEIKQGQVKGIGPDIDNMEEVLHELAKHKELNRTYKSYYFKGMAEKTQIQKWHSAVEIRRQADLLSCFMFMCVPAGTITFCRHDYEGCFLNFASINQSVFCKYTAQSVYAIKCVCWLSSLLWLFPFLGSAPQSRNAFTFHCSFNLWTASHMYLYLVHKS